MPSSRFVIVNPKVEDRRDLGPLEDDVDGLHWRDILLPIGIALAVTALMLYLQFHPPDPHTLHPLGPFTQTTPGLVSNAPGTPSQEVIADEAKKAQAQQRKEEEALLAKDRLRTAKDQADASKENVQHVVGDTADALRGAWEKGKHKASDAKETTKDYLQAGKDKVVDSAQAATDTIKATASTAGQKVKDSGETLLDYARTGKDAAVDATKKAGEKIQDSASKTSETAKEYLHQGKEKIVGAGETVLDYAQTAGQDIKQAATTAGEKIKDTTLEAGEVVKDSAQWVGEKAKGTLKAGKDMVVDYTQDAAEAASQAKEAVKDTASAGIEKGKEYAQAGREKVGEYAQGAKEAVQDYTQSGQEKLKEARDKAADVAQGTQEGIKDRLGAGKETLADAGGTTKEALRGVKDQVVEAGQTAKDYAQAAGGKLTETLKGAREGAMEGGRRLKDALDPTSNKEAEVTIAGDEEDGDSSPGSPKADQHEQDLEERIRLGKEFADRRAEQGADDASIGSKLVDYLRAFVSGESSASGLKDEDLQIRKDKIRDALKRSGLDKGALSPKTLDPKSAKPAIREAIREVLALHGVDDLGAAPPEQKTSEETPDIKAIKFAVGEAVRDMLQTSGLGDQQQQQQGKHDHGQQASTEAQVRLIKDAVNETLGELFQSGGLAEIFRIRDGTSPVKKDSSSQLKAIKEAVNETVREILKLAGITPSGYQPKELAIAFYFDGKDHRFAERFTQQIRDEIKQQQGPEISLEPFTRSTMEEVFDKDFRKNIVAGIYLVDVADSRRTLGEVDQELFEDMVRHTKGNSVLALIHNGEDFKLGIGKLRSGFDFLNTHKQYHVVLRRRNGEYHKELNQERLEPFVKHLLKRVRSVFERKA